MLGMHNQFHSLETVGSGEIDPDDGEELELAGVETFWTIFLKTMFLGFSIAVNSILNVSELWVGQSKSGNPNWRFKASI